jgi:glutamine cyclotransferase
MGYFSLPEENCPVIDGIAYDGKGLWVTGKECPSIYYLKKLILRVTKIQKNMFW